MDHAQKVPFFWLPRRSKFYYLCETRELHQVRLLVWGRWILRKRDKMILPMDAMLNLVFAMAPEMKGPTDSEGKPVVQ